MDLKYYKILGDRKYSHCGFMKIMAPKDVRMGDNPCIYNLFCPCFCSLAEKIKECFEKLSWLRCLSIGFNVGTFHRFFAFAGFAYLLYADFGNITYSEF